MCKNISINKRTTILINYYKIFLIPESMVAFISGMFISVATNIVTSSIPNGLMTIGLEYIFSAILMLIASVAMMIWAICVKPIQDLFSKDTILGPAGSKDWYEFIHDPKRKEVLVTVNICLLIATICVSVSVILWSAV